MTWLLFVFPILGTVTSNRMCPYEWTDPLIISLDMSELWPYPVHSHTRQNLPHLSTVFEDCWSLMGKYRLQLCCEPISPSFVSLYFSFPFQLSKNFIFNHFSIFKNNATLYIYFSITHTFITPVFLGWRCSITDRIPILACAKPWVHLLHHAEHDMMVYNHNLTLG